MSDELVKSYKERITTLEEENRTLRNEASSRRHKAKELRTQLDTVTKERDELLTSRTTLETELKDVKAKATAEPSELAQEVDRLKGVIRTRDHKDAFRKVAKEANVLDEYVEDLWNLSGYKAEGEQADEAKLKELVGELVKSRPRLLAETTTTTTDATSTAAASAAKSGTTITTPATRPGPGAARTTSDTTQAAALSVQQRVDRDFAKHSISGHDGRL